MKKILLVAVVCGFAAAAQATVIWEEDFDSRTTGVLAGQGSWASSKAGTGVLNEATVIAGGLSYNVSGGGTINGGTNALGQYKLQSGETLSGPTINVGLQDVYFRYLVQSPNAVGDTEEFFQLNGWNTYVASKYTTPATEFKLNGGSTLTPAFSENSDVHLVVVKLTSDLFTGFTNMDIWFDPTYGASGTPDASGTGSETLTSFALNIKHYNENVTIDELLFATTWDEVVPAPEPMTMGLLGLGGLAVLRRRRRA